MRTAMYLLKNTIIYSRGRAPNTEGIAIGAGELLEGCLSNLLRRDEDHREV